MIKCIKVKATRIRTTAQAIPRQRIKKEENRNTIVSYEAKNKILNSNGFSSSNFVQQSIPKLQENGLAEGFLKFQIII